MQRSARIDQIMKLYPTEQTSTCISQLSLHQKQPQQQQHQQLQPSKMVMLAGSQGNLTANIYPPSSEIVPSAAHISLSSSSSSAAALASMKSRYGGHNHRANRYPTISQTMLIGHKQTPTSYPNSFAPQSLPLELSPMVVNCMNHNITQPEMTNGYAHHVCLSSPSVSSGSGSGSTCTVQCGGNSTSSINYINACDSSMNNTAGQMTQHNNNKTSVYTTSNNGESNDQEEGDSPMVGVCVQQSSVVIH